MSEFNSQSESSAIKVVVAGCVGIFASVGTLIGALPLMVFSAIGILYALIVGYGEYGRIQSGELPASEGPMVMGGMAAGGLGCLANIGFGFFWVFFMIGLIAAFAS